MIFLAWKPEHMLTFLVCVFVFCFFLLGLYFKIHYKIHGKNIRKRSSGDAESSSINLL